MEITIKFTNASAKRTEYFLQRRYKSKAKLDKLAKVAILTEAAQEAQKDTGTDLHAIAYALQAHRKDFHPNFPATSLMANEKLIKLLRSVK